MLLSTPLFFALLSFASASALERRAVAFFAPNANGGSQLDDTGNGLGEPLNVRLCRYVHNYLWMLMLISINSRSSSLA